MLTAMNDYVDGIENLKAFGIPGQYPIGINGLGVDTGMNYGALPSPDQCKAWMDDNSISTAEFRRRGCNDDGTVATSLPAPKAGGTMAPQNPQGGIAQGAQAIAAAVASILPAFKHPPKGKTIYQKEPDYTTYAVIFGAVIVASVLAIAVGRSGRKRE